MKTATGKQIIENFIKAFEGSSIYSITKNEEKGILLKASSITFELNYDEISEVKLYESGNAMIHFNKGGFIFIFKNKCRIEMEA
jgi:hypothetical protein